MKRILIVWLAALLPFIAMAQMGPSATWTFSATKTDLKAGDETELIFSAEIPKDWYMYSNEFEGEGPIKAAFKFTKHSSYQLIGGVKAQHPKTKQDEFFGEVKIFKGKAEFRQKIKVLAPSPVIKAMIVEYQICSDVTGQCIGYSDIPADFSRLLKVTGTAKRKRKRVYL